MQTSPLPLIQWRALALLLFALCWHDVASAAAGYIQLVVGKATIWERNASERTAHKDMQLYEGDAIATGPGSTVQIRLKDDTLIFVYENSRLKIDQYRFSSSLAKSQGSKDSAVLQLVKGAARTVTGLIGEANKDAFSIKTATATIGIRGTDFDTAFIEASNSASPAAAGTYNRVYSGSTIVKSAAGIVEVAENEAVFVGLKPGDKPERLKEIPEFMRTLERTSAPPGPAPTNQEVITLRYRAAEEILPLLKPLLNATAAVTGQGKRLVLAAPEAKRAELKAAIEAFDIPLRRVQITVRFDNPITAKNNVEISSRSRGNEPIEQRLQVIEGQRAFFYEVQTQIPEQLLISSQGLLVLKNPQSPSQTRDSLEIVPRIVRDSVVMEFYITQSTAGGTANRSPRTQRIGSTVSAKWGEWVDAGGSVYGNANAGSVTTSTNDLRRNNRLLFLRADEVQ